MSSCATWCWLMLGMLAAVRAQPLGDPRLQEVPLPAHHGWKASLIAQRDVGVWALGVHQLLPRYGCPEVIGLDDRGRCTIHVSYSGKWSRLETIEDSAWLGAMVHHDLDPTIEGEELYVGGKGGRLHQIVPRPGPPFDTAVVAEWPGEEIHALAALPIGDRPTLLVFMRSGLLARVEFGPQEVSVGKLWDLPGRVRDVVILPEGRVICALRAQRVLELRFEDEGPAVRELLRAPMGFGRLARRPPEEGRPEVLYATRDDGVLLRLEEGADGRWKREVIFAGAQGLRGCAAGRFDRDPDVETVAVFGYGRRVVLLSRRDRGWKAEALYEDVAAGHWLETAELDGRNTTDELVASGYSGRIVLLAREPGYGLDGVPTEPTLPTPPKAASAPAETGAKAPDKAPANGG